MDNLSITLIVYLIALLVLVFSGMPIAFALGILAMGSVFLGFGTKLLPAMATIAWDSLASFILIAIPLFIFMGVLLFESGLSTRIYDAIYPLLDRVVPGGLLHTNVVVGAILAACCGSSVASTASIGSVALPEMERRKYDKKIATGSIAAGGTLAVLIPPSILLIVYGAMTQTSVAKLFIGGIIPGIILVTAYMLYIGIRIKIQPHLVPQTSESETGRLPWKACLLSPLKVLPILIVIAGVLGSIYLGIATPSEAAAIGCVLVAAVAAMYRMLNWDILKRAITGTVRTSGMIFPIYLGAVFMGIYLSNSGITATIANRVANLPLSPLAIFMIVLLLYIILGMVMDSFAALVMTIPVTFPIVMQIGFEPIWFGIMVTMLCECGLLTPPIGMGLFVIQGIRPDYSFMDIVKGCQPFFLVILCVLAILIAFPNIVTFLPNTMK